MSVFLLYHEVLADNDLKCTRLLYSNRAYVQFNTDNFHYIASTITHQLGISVYTVRADSNLITCFFQPDYEE